MAKVTMEPLETAGVTVTEAAAPEGVLKALSLDQITLDPVTDVRSGPVAKDETAKIEALAKSMFMNGQIHPVVVRPNGQEGKYLLVAGRRRFAAKKLMAELAASGKHPELAEKPITIDALIVNKSDDEAWAASIQENLQRRQFSPIELAQNIVDIKKRKGWDGEDWSKHVAEFLHVSRATVTQHAKLLDLPKELRDKVHRGELSAQSAFDLREVQERQGAAKAVEVAKRAEELAQEEEKEQPVKAKSGKADAKDGKSAKSGKADKADAEEKGKVKRKHVLAAAREAETIIKPRTRNEIVGFFQEILDSADPYPEPIQDFCKTLVNRWAAGTVGDRALLNKLDIIAEMCGEKRARKSVAKAS
jgi:ParB/RepB/Spo0J family partition protein